MSAPVVESSSPDAIARRARGRVAARWLAVVLPAVLALVLGLQRSMAVPFWRDEYATAAFARLPLGDLLQALGQVDAVLGPYYLLAHLASPVLGLETGLRVLSLGAFTASAAVVAVIALRWWGPLAASAAGLAFATNVLAITYGAMARPYALAVLFVALAVLAADAAAGSGRRWAWVAYAAAASAAVAMHVLALVAVVLTGLLVVARRREPGRRPIPWWCGMTAVPVAVAVAQLARGLGQRGQLDWMSEPTVRTAIADLARAAGVSIDREVAFDAVALLVLAAMTAAAIAAAARTPSFQNIEPPAPIRASAVARARPVAFAAALAFVPWALLLGASWLVTPILATRYIAWSSIGTALAVAAAVRAAQTASKRLAIIAGVLAAIVLAVSIGFAATRPWNVPPRGDDFPAVVELLRSEAVPGDLLVVQQRYYEGGVAYGFATSANDPEHLADVAAHLPGGEQPLLDVRRISSTEPLRSVADDQADADGDTVWLVGLLQPVDADLADVDPSLAHCIADMEQAPFERFGALHVYRLDCGTTSD